MASCPGGSHRTVRCRHWRKPVTTAGASGIRQAMMIMALLCAWSALHYLLAARNLRKDLDTHYVARA